MPEESNACIVLIVYLSIIFAWANHFIVFVYPRIIWSGAKRTPADVIEFIFIEIFYILMIWSHLYTMCTDPGFIPKGYRYREDLLPVKYKIHKSSKEELTPSEKNQRMQKKKINPISNGDIELGSSKQGRISIVETSSNEKTRDELTRDEVLNMQKMCDKCQCVKPPRSHHCSICK